MKPLSFSLSLLLLVLSGHTHAQVSALSPSLPSSTLLGHYRIGVPQNTTTVLIFPSAIKPVDRGSRDVLAQKQPGVDNVLKLKAAKKDFPETNLHVFTADGRIYAFDIAYSDTLAATYDLRNLQVLRATSDSSLPLRYSDQALDAATLDRYVRHLQSPGSGGHGPTACYALMRLRLQHVALGGPLIFFRFQLANFSNLDYSLDFVRLYIRDRQKAKRTSVQEQEVTPVYQDSTDVIAGGATRTYIVAVPAFTLAGGKEFIVEVHEKNGGRSLLLRIRNYSLLSAEKL